MGSPEDNAKSKKSSPKPRSARSMRAFDKEELARAWLSPSSSSMRELARQFCDAISDEKLESCMAMLASCPDLATYPISKALYSPLHWSCASVKMAPLTKALLAMGANPNGLHGVEDSSHDQEAKGARSFDPPLAWCISSGNRIAAKALMSKGCSPTQKMLHEACRRGQGGLVCDFLEANRLLDPDAAISENSGTPRKALLDYAKGLSLALVDRNRCISEAFAAMDKISLGEATGGSSSSGRSSKRL